MRVCAARHLRVITVVVSILVTAALSSCGDPTGDTGTAGSQTSTSVDTSDLDSVAQAWGEALLTSDWEAVARLIEPNARPTIIEHLDQFATLTPPSKPTLRDLSFEVVEQDADSAAVRYSGERCAPTISKTFGPSTVIGDAGSDSTSLSSNGVIVEGEVVCTDLADVPEGPLLPATFVRLDGQCYGVLPGV